MEQQDNKEAYIYAATIEYQAAGFSEAEAIDLAEKHYKELESEDIKNNMPYAYHL